MWMLGFWSSTWPLHLMASTWKSPCGSTAPENTQSFRKGFRPLTLILQSPLLHFCPDMQQEFWDHAVHNCIRYVNDVE